MRKLDDELINVALETPDYYPASRGENLEIIVIGGSNLVCSAFITRPTTKNIDLLGGRMPNGDIFKLRPLPPKFARAVAQVARQLGLPPNWINLRPDSLLDKVSRRASAPDSSEKNTGRWWFGLQGASI